MSMGVRSWRFPSSSTPNIHEAVRKDVAASLHKNVLPWSVWRGHQVRTESASSPSLRRVTQSAGVDCLPQSRQASNLFRTASVPDVVADGGNPGPAFSSITISARKVQAQSVSSLRPETFCPSSHAPTGATMRALAPPAEPYRSRAYSGMQSSKCSTSVKGFGCALRPSASQPDLCMQVPTTTRAKEGNQGNSSTCDRVTVRGPGGNRQTLLEHRHSFTEGDRKTQDFLLGDSTTMTLSSSRSYCSHIDLQVPLRSSSTVVFWDKSLSLSLAELEGRRALHTSTLSVRLRGSSCRELCALDNKPALTDGGYRRTKAVTRVGETRAANLGSSLSRRQQGLKAETTAPALHGVKREADDSDTRSQGTAWPSAVLQGPSSYTQATRGSSNADEADRSTQSNFRHHASPVNSQTWGKQALGETTEQRGHRGTQREMSCQRSHQLDKLNVNRQTLSLKEALELFRPDFISRSQGRVRRLEEQRTRRRRALLDSNLDLTQQQQGQREDGGGRRRNCTTPHPLSDNLFRPRERSISGREMQLRSKRIYNNLPEVTNKKKEERKRVVSQTNRLRAEVFKKKLLGQVLQR